MGKIGAGSAGRRRVMKRDPRPAGLRRMVRHSCRQSEDGSLESKEGIERCLSVLSFSVHGRTKNQHVRHPIPSQALGQARAANKGVWHSQLIIAGEEEAATGASSSPARGEPRKVSFPLFRIVPTSISAFLENTENQDSHRVERERVPMVTFHAITGGM